MSTPLVSVVMPALDEARFVEEAVASVLGQTLSALELIVVDDGSTDETVAIVERLAADERVRLRRQDREGLVAALNLGCAAARAPYIARLDADDVARPSRLEVQVAELERRPALAALGSWVRYIDADGRALGEWRTPSGPALVRWSLNFGTQLAHPSVVMRRSAFEAAGGYTGAAPHAEDYDLWLRLAELGELDNVPRILVDRRVHGTSVSDKNAEAQERSVRHLMKRAAGGSLSDEDVVAIRDSLTSPGTVGPATLRVAATAIRTLLSARLRSASSREEAGLLSADAARRTRDLARASRRSSRLLWARLVVASSILRLRRR